MAPVAVVSHYRFAPQPLTALPALQAAILAAAEAAELKGTVLLAEEGINLTMAGEPDALRGWFNQLQMVIANHSAWQQLWEAEATTVPVWSTAPEIPFGKLVVDIRPEIVTFREPDLIGEGGRHISPEEWNTVLAAPNTITLDVRNGFEVGLGSFETAIDPCTDTFTQFKAYVAENLPALQAAEQVAMFCTGGIRCEKASVYLKQQGIANVVQLQGGILNYLQTIPPEASRWQGECFVFDGRVTLGHGLAPTGNYERDKDKIVPVAHAV